MPYRLSVFRYTPSVLLQGHGGHLGKLVLFAMPTLASLHTRSKLLSVGVRHSEAAVLAWMTARG